MIEEWKRLKESIKYNKEQLEKIQNGDYPMKEVQLKICRENIQEYTERLEKLENEIREIVKYFTEGDEKNEKNN